jgi:hypothetical protein
MGISKNVMTTQIPLMNKGFSAGIPLLFLTLSVAVPLMERDDLLSQKIVESEHNPLQCQRGHDHTVCTQVGTNLLVQPPSASVTPTVFLTVRMPDFFQKHTAHLNFLNGHHPRAPPTLKNTSPI